ncbi:MAG: hypothetical protein GX257_10840 [Clostridiales bacterium]|jgi:hypothetical protein|nr:hypothetical protein [Clostridiales bacterium]
MEEAKVIQLSNQRTLEPQEVYKHITKTYLEEDAGILLNFFYLLDNIKKIPQRETYRIKSHEQVEFNEPDKSVRNFREEEWVCKKMALCHKDGHIFGSIVGYQIPLKVPGAGEQNAKLGKLDLLSVKEDTAYILELKAKNSTEQPLKAFLEAYTYWKQLGGDNSKEFLDKSDAAGCCRLDKAVVFYEGSDIHNRLMDSSQTVKDLIRKLKVRCFLVKGDGRPSLLFETSREFDFKAWK